MLEYKDIVFNEQVISYPPLLGSNVNEELASSVVAETVVVSTVGL